MLLLLPGKPAGLLFSSMLLSGLSMVSRLSVAVLLLLTASMLLLFDTFSHDWLLARRTW